jgi:hypothetical protein
MKSFRRIVVVVVVVTIAIGNDFETKSKREALQNKSKSTIAGFMHFFFFLLSVR